MGHLQSEAFSLESALRPPPLARGQLLVRVFGDLSHAEARPGPVNKDAHRDGAVFLEGPTHSAVFGMKATF
eukprot:153081-Alexandrium_andersonii.AAC.1